jgi:hypothetical protein
VPRIREFYGIVIAMYYAEHGIPHFHAVYAGDDASIAIDSLEILAGSLPTVPCDSSGSGPGFIAPSSRRTGTGLEMVSRSSASRP